MTTVTCQHPLKYPTGWNPTPSAAISYPHKFPQNLSVDDALRYLEDELSSCKVDQARLHSNYQHLNNERSRRHTGGSNGVSIVFTIAGEKHHMACDKWQLVEHNLYALHLALHSMRQLQEWGIASPKFILSAFSDKMQNAQRTNAQISGGGDLPSWLLKLGLGPTATLEDANAVYRRRAKELSGNESELMELNQAIDEARSQLR